MDMRSVTTEALILRGRDYSEGDRILVLLTRDFGKLPALAKGVRKPKSKLKAATQLFSYSKLTLNKSGSMGIVTQGETVQSLYGLREDLNKIACASYVGEMVDIAMADYKPSEDLFVLTASVLTLLEQAEDPYVILKFFELRLLSAMGYRPQLEKCVACNRSLRQGTFYLVPARGGVVCNACRGTYTGKPLSAGAIQTMDRLLQWDLRKLFQLRISQPMRKELDAAIYCYLDYYLDKSAKARAALQEYLA